MQKNDSTSNNMDSSMKYKKKDHFKVRNLLYCNLEQILSSFLKQEVSASEMNRVGLSWAIHIYDKNRYFIPQSLNPLTDNQYIYYPILLKKRDEGHFMLLIRDTNTEIYYLFNPNGTFDEESLYGKNYILSILSEISDNITILEHRPFNCTANYGWYPFDDGLCGAWIIYIAQAISSKALTNMTPIDIIKDIESMSWEERGNQIYKFASKLSDFIP